MNVRDCGLDTVLRNEIEHVHLIYGKEFFGARTVFIHEDITY